MEGGHVLHEIGHTALQVIHLVLSGTPSPAPAAHKSDSNNYAGIAAIVASTAGLVSAVGAIIIGLHNKKDAGTKNSEAADKAIEYLIKQNKELLQVVTQQQKGRTK